MSLGDHRLVEPEGIPVWPCGCLVGTLQAVGLISGLVLTLEKTTVATDIVQAAVQLPQFLQLRGL